MDLAVVREYTSVPVMTAQWFRPAVVANDLCELSARTCQKPRGRQESGRK